MPPESSGGRQLRKTGRRGVCKVPQRQGSNNGRHDDGEVAGRGRGGGSGNRGDDDEEVAQRNRRRGRSGAVTTEATVAVEVAAKAAMRESGTPEEMVEVAIVRAARASGVGAVNMVVRRAAEIVVVESMQAGGMEAARGEIAGAVQAMGWGAAEARIIEVVQTMVVEGGESASAALEVDLGELQVDIVWV